MLNPNTFGGDFNKIGKLKVGRKGSLLAFVISQSGLEDYTLYFKNLDNNKLLSDKIEHVTHGFEWSVSGNSIIYVTAGKIPGGYHVLRHIINTPNEKDVLLNEKGKEIVLHSMEKSTNNEYIFYLYNQRGKTN